MRARFGRRIFVGSCALAFFAVSCSSGTGRSTISNQPRSSASSVAASGLGFCSDLKQLRVFQRANPSSAVEARSVFQNVLPVLSRLVADAPGDMKAAAEQVATSVDYANRVLAKYDYDVDRALREATSQDQTALDVVGNPNDPSAAKLNDYEKRVCGPS